MTKTVIIDDIHCRASTNVDDGTLIKIDWPDGHGILISREEAASLRDWLTKVLDAVEDEPVIE